MKIHPRRPNQRVPPSSQPTDITAAHAIGMYWPAAQAQLANQRRRWQAGPLPLASTRTSGATSTPAPRSTTGTSTPALCHGDLRLPGAAARGLSGLRHPGRGDRLHHPVADRPVQDPDDLVQQRTGLRPGRPAQAGDRRRVRLGWVDLRRRQRRPPPPPPTPPGNIKVRSPANGQWGSTTQLTGLTDSEPALAVVAGNLQVATPGMDNPPGSAGSMAPGAATPRYPSTSHSPPRPWPSTRDGYIWAQRHRW
jgi:hypothetical protein